MTLKMPSDPFGTPGGFFGFVDPPQAEESSFDEAYPLPDSSPNFDFVMDFEADLDSSFEVVRDVFRGGDVNEPTPLVEVNPSPQPVSTEAPRMPTIFEEDEREEEDGDITVTPNEAQRALLPPDRFAQPPSAAQVAGSAGASQDAWLDSMDTPRPGGGFCFVFYLSGWFCY